MASMAAAVSTAASILWPQPSITEAHSGKPAAPGTSSACQEECNWASGQSQKKWQAEMTGTACSPWICCNALAGTSCNARECYLDC